MKQPWQRAIRYAFTTVNIAKIFAGHHPHNEASRALLLKLGFHFTHAEYYYQTGLDHPSYLLRKEDFLK